jgi:hypothetical protein
MEIKPIASSLDWNETKSQIIKILSVSGIVNNPKIRGGMSVGSTVNDNRECLVALIMIDAKVKELSIAEVEARRTRNTHAVRKILDEINNILNDMNEYLFMLVLSS